MHGKMIGKGLRGDEHGTAEIDDEQPQAPNQEETKVNACFRPGGQ